MSEQKIVKLTELLTSEQLEVVESICRENPDQLDACNKLRRYLSQFKTELEAKGVLHDYLAYVIVFQIHGQPNGKH